MSLIPRWSRPEQFQKGFVPGTGSYTDTNGQPSLSGRSLQRRWSTGSTTKYFATLFAFIWNSVCSVMLIAAWNNGPVSVNHVSYPSFTAAFAEHPFIAIFGLFPLIGVIVAYWAALEWVNRTRVVLEGEDLFVWRGPLPCARRLQRIEISKFSQLYVEQYSSHSQNNRPVIAYRLVAQMKVGPKIVIDSGMSDYADARILEQWIESKLGIEDAVVLGEVGT